MSLTSKHQQRINIKTLEPECWKLVIAIENYLAKTSLDKKLRELIKIRASQINKCAFCIDLHTKDAIKFGESERRIFALPAWKESPLFSNKEQAVLKLTEEITEISKDGVSDKTFETIRKYFSENETAQIIIAINHMNFLNRVAVSTKMMHPH
ncbi:carboxymuconolactone decarboxylase family protein [Maribellus maritimus]|uniref:carboxymuconolactone decarboxylase family protein n=1 Tax=Maribellus maritimus TaxID=2870838 RepID=UPI001EEC21C1|nr:carboxymuconolactone decarboxylase family protein [Maribellus maritimus]MCG6191023.1 carboxymuconolactone decarboxylase family protein [Maribellus maritimus]